MNIRKETITFALALIGGLSAAGVVPEGLCPGDTIALFTPSSAVEADHVHSFARELGRRGYAAIPTPHAFGDEYPPYPAPHSERAADFVAALQDPQVKAIVCNRGGYGSVHMLPFIPDSVVRANPKWVTGFSDVSILHALMKKAGVASIHGPMSEIASRPESSGFTYLLKALNDPYSIAYSLPSCHMNNPGEARGKIYGGNLVTINELAETPWDIFADADTTAMILFVEEVDEPVHSVERILTRLHLSGRLGQLKGIIFGEFTKMKPDEGYNTTEEMLHLKLSEWGYYEDSLPVVYNFPAGHSRNNLPIVFGLEATLTVHPDRTVTLRYERPAQ